MSSRCKELVDHDSNFTASVLLSHIAIRLEWIIPCRYTGEGAIMGKGIISGITTPFLISPDDREACHAAAQG
jgi:hypothetical protein